MRSALMLSICTHVWWHLQSKSCDYTLNAVIAYKNPNLKQRISNIPFSKFGYSHTNNRYAGHSMKLILLNCILICLISNSNQTEDQVRM